MKEQKTKARVKISTRQIGKIISLILSLAIILTVAAVPAAAEDNYFTSGDYQFRLLENDTAEITAYNGDRDALIELVVPDKLGGKEVTSIHFRVFSGCKNLESVTLPKSLTKIGWESFWYCQNLKSVTIPEGVTYVGQHAFTGCSNLKEITVPKSVTLIYDYAFGYDIASWAVSNSFKKIDGFKILGFTNTAAQRYADENGFEFVSVGEIPTFEYAKNDDGTIEITAYNGSAANLVVPDEIDGKKVVSIGKSAFRSCKTVKNLTVSEGISEIGDYAFLGCGNLESVTLPKSLTKIGLQAFSFCENLADVTLSEGLTEIGYYAFSDCLSLKEITVPKSVTSIGDNAFGKYNTHMDENGNYIQDKIEGFKILGFKNTAAQRYADENGFEFVSVGEVSLFEYTENGDETIEITAYNGSAADLIIPDEIDGKKVTSIGEWAFKYCTTLKNLTVSEGISEIGDYAFLGCGNLESVTLPKSLTKIGLQAFSFCENLADVTLSEGLTEIGFFAFSDCLSLKEITIPKSLTSIGNYAFENCTNLKTVTIPKNVTYIGEYSFGYNGRLDENGKYVHNKVDDFKIKGYTGTAAEDYADDNGFEFIALDNLTGIPGDINGNGKVNSEDNVLFARYLAGRDVSFEINTTVADLNGDGNINSMDNVVLQRYLAGWGGYEILPLKH